MKNAAFVVCDYRNNSTLQALCHTRKITAEMSNRHVFSLYKRRTNKCKILFTYDIFLPSSQH